VRKILILIEFIVSMNLTALFADGPGNVKGMIVYAALAGDGNGSSIYAVSPDGKIKKRLTMSVGSDCYPAVSPDGNTIVFSAVGSDYKYRIFAIDGAGEHLKQLAETDHDAILASWSPDGKRIAFLDRESDHTTCIYLVNPDGTGLTRLVSDAKHDDDYQYPPEWSGDGKRIFYDKKDMQSENDTMPACMYIVNTDGSGEMPFGDHNRTQCDGSWCSENDKVVYYSEKRKFNYNRQDNAGIFLMDSSGAGETYLAPGNRPVWSPDGSLIAYTSSCAGNNHIFIMYPDGTGPGKSEVFTNMEGEESGGDPIPLQISFDHSPGVKDPVWSPDGKMIAFVTDTWDMATNMLYVADIAGNAPLALAGNVLGRSRPDWK